MKTVKLKPKDKELMVRDPETRVPLKKTGEEKPLNAYWIRRIKDGSVIQMSSPTTKASKEDKE
ncbi:DUF2635 domain-containing protein [Vibrio scophthalmi]|uniref:Mu-like prophage FluMu protein gp38 n=1 Tax=Vibrio scophthalmi TaxID=45658 RepID=A0A1E3WIZ8_9VIBR|nr:DUF2635 domain-containing protein [Vibrio scophthalmi]ODS09731.1 Mu-like prophage FluMu protein gp38 [Vibrio scophthalmi]